MKKLDSSAAALTLAAFTLTGAAVANDSNADAALSNAALTDWAQLDQDIQALSANLQGTGGGINWGGRIRAFYENSGDIDTDPGTAGSQDLGGFSIYNARLYAHGTVYDGIKVRLEVDFAGASTATPGAQTARLLDAYMDIPVGETITIRTGQFRAHVLRSSLIDSGNLMFADRSAVASLFSGRSQGIAAIGKFDKFNFGVTVQNGSDGVTDDLFYAVRGEFDVMGTGTDLVQGAYGASEDMEASIGAAYFNDDVGSANGDGIAVDASLATNRFSFEAAFVDLGDVAPASNVDINERSLFMPLAMFQANTTPFSVQGSVMLTTQDENSSYGAWELAARFQDLDSSNDTRIFDVGLNYYVSGHDMKYILNWTSVDSNTGSPDFDGDIIRVGVQTRF